MAWGYDTCPKCGGSKRSKNKQCGDCRGYGRKRHRMPSGYMRVYVPGHPTASRDGYALEHRYVLYEAGMRLPTGAWHVHHIDGDKANNAVDNLAVLTASAHHRLHARQSGFVENQYGVWPVGRTA